MKQALFLTLGYPGSGKSTFAKQLATKIGAVRLNSDELRRTIFTDIKDIRNPINNPFVFGGLDYATHQVLQAGYGVIYDANNNHLAHRQKGEEIASQLGLPTIVLWVQAPLDIARQREASRAAAKEMIHIPPERYQQLIDSLEAPVADEQCITIDGLQTFDEQFASFQAQTTEMGMA